MSADWHNKMTALEVQIIALTVQVELKKRHNKMKALEVQIMA